MIGPTTRETRQSLHNLGLYALPLLPMMETTLVTATELADALGVDRSTVHRRIERGAIKPTHYAGDQPLFTREAAQAILHGPVKPAEPAERAS